MICQRCGVKTEKRHHDWQICASAIRQDAQRRALEAQEGTKAKGSSRKRNHVGSIDNATETRYNASNATRSDLRLGQND